MSRLARVTNAVNWRYAFGEVALIVIGILIALAFADWNDRRSLREQELAMLTELRTELRQDLDAIENALKGVLIAEQKLVALTETLATPQPYDPSMDELFGTVYGTRIIFLNSAAYETLKSSGLQVVSNDPLRLKIAGLFSGPYEVMNMNNDIDMEINLDLLRPYYLQHFSNLRFVQSATPINYDHLVADPYYHNIVHYRLAVLRNNRITSYTAAIDEVREVLAMLDEELG